MGKSRREIRALSDALDLDNIDQDVLWSFLTRKNLPQELSPSSCEFDIFLSNLKAEIDDVLNDKDDPVVVYPKYRKENEEKRLLADAKVTRRRGGSFGAECTPLSDEEILKGRAGDSQAGVASVKSGTSSRPRVLRRRGFSVDSLIPKPPRRRSAAHGKHSVSFDQALGKDIGACASWAKFVRPKGSRIPLPQKQSDAPRAKKKESVSQVVPSCIKEGVGGGDLQKDDLYPSQSSRPHSQNASLHSSRSSKSKQLSGRKVEITASTNPVLNSIPDDELFTKLDLESYLHSGSGVGAPVARSIRSVVERLLDVEGMDERDPGTWLHAAQDLTDTESVASPSSNVPWIKDFDNKDEGADALNTTCDHPAGVSDGQPSDPVEAIAESYSREEMSSDMGAPKVDSQVFEVESLSQSGLPHAHCENSILTSCIGVVKTCEENLSVCSSEEWQDYVPLDWSTPVHVEEVVSGSRRDTGSSGFSNLVSLDCKGLPVIGESPRSESPIQECIGSEGIKPDRVDSGLLDTQNSIGSSVLEWSFPSPRPAGGNFSVGVMASCRDDIHPAFSYKDDRSQEAIGIAAAAAEPESESAAAPAALNITLQHGIQISGRESEGEAATPDSGGFRPLLKECLWTNEFSSTNSKDSSSSVQESKGCMDLVATLPDHSETYCADWPGVEGAGHSLDVGMFQPGVLWSSGSSKEDIDLLCDDLADLGMNGSHFVPLTHFEDLSFGDTIGCKLYDASLANKNSAHEHLQLRGPARPAQNLTIVPGSVGHESTSMYSLSVRDWIMSSNSHVTNKDITSMQTMSSSCASSLPCLTELYIRDGYKFTGHNPLWIGRAECESEEVVRLKPVDEAEAVPSELNVACSIDKVDVPGAGGGSTSRTDSTDGFLSQWARAVGRDIKNLSGNKQVWYSPPKMGMASRLASIAYRRAGPSQNPQHANSVGCTSCMFFRPKRKGRGWDRVWERRSLGS